MVQGSDKPQKVPDFVMTLRDYLKEALIEAQHQKTEEVEHQKHYYDKTTNLVVLIPGDTVLLKSDVCVGKRKINDQWDNMPYTVVWQIAPDALVYEIREKERHRSSTTTDSSSLLWNEIMSLSALLEVKRH